VTPGLREFGWRRRRKDALGNEFNRRRRLVLEGQDSSAIHVESLGELLLVCFSRW